VTRNTVLGIDEQQKAAVLAAAISVAPSADAVLAPFGPMLRPLADVAGSSNEAKVMDRRAGT
jgi:hypothetical protein